MNDPLFSKSDDEGGRGGQKFRKIDDVFYERPLRTLTNARESAKAFKKAKRLEVSSMRTLVSL